MRSSIRQSLFIAVFTAMPLLCLAQTITIGDLENFISKSGWGPINSSLISKGWEYYESEKGSETSLSTIVWSYERGYGDKASGWFYVYTYYNKPSQISYDVFNIESFELISNALPAHGYKLIDNEILDNKITSTFSSENYYLKVTTSKRENDYNKSITSYSILLIEKGGYFDPNNGPKTSYWFGTDKIWLQYNLKDGEYHGTYKRFYYSGVLEIEGTYENGKRNGTFTEYSKDGSIDAVYQMKDDSLHGSFKTYHVNGNINQIGKYRNGKRHGTFNYYDDETGGLIYSLIYDNGTLSGPYTVYHLNGKISISGNFANGMKEGAFKEFSEEGQLIAEYTIHEDSLHGKFKEYDNGKLISEANYDMGVKHGYYREIITVFDGTHILEIEGNYNLGVKDKTWKYSTVDSESQTVFLMINYENGRKNGDYFERSGDTLYFTNYNNDKLHGNYKAFIDTTSAGHEYRISDNLIPIISGTYKFDKKDGEWNFYDSIGRVTKSGFYKNGNEYSQFKYYTYTTTNSYVVDYVNYSSGKLNGPYYKLNSGGDTLMAGSYNYGKKNGKWTESQIDSTNSPVEYFYGRYSNDKKEGQWVTQSIDRKTICTMEYLDGKLDGIIQYFYDDHSRSVGFIVRNNILTTINIFYSDTVFVSYEIQKQGYNKYEVIEVLTREGSHTRTTYLMYSETSLTEYHTILTEIVDFFDEDGKADANKTGKYIEKREYPQKLEISGDYWQGSKNWEWTYYYLEQDVLVKRSYVNGQVDKEQFFVHSNGKPFSGTLTVIDYENNLIIEIKVKDGLRHGWTKTYDLFTESEISKVKFKNGDTK